MKARRPRVFVPEPLPDSALDFLRVTCDVAQGLSERACSEDELIEETRKSDALIITSRDRIDRTVIHAAPQLMIIAKAGAKPNNVDIEAARAQGTLVTWTPGANSVSVAEYSIALALMLVKHVHVYNRHLLAGGWRTYDLLGSELHGKTAGLIGFGAIGREVARRLRAFDMDVIVYDPGVPAAQIELGGAAAADLEATVSAADFLFLHCELNEQTRNLIDEKALRSMKPSAMLINTARGGLVDETALVQALKQGWIAGAGLDVFVVEPTSPTNELLRLPNVLATPHMAAFSKEAIRRETHWAVEDVALVLSGGEPRHWRDA